MENIVLLKDMLGALKECDFKDTVIPMGKDVNGNYVYENFSKMNHILIAGSTGSGKSVFLNNVIISLTKQLDSSKLELILIDPKTIEFSQYAEKKYAYYDVNANEVNHVFEDLIKEMERRYGLFVDYKVKNIEEYNALDENKNNQLKHIVVIVDELADLIINNDETIKDVIKLVQRSRASGINLVVASQALFYFSEDGRDIKNVINNFPTHITFRLLFDTDSQLVLSTNEAINLTTIGECIVALPNKKYQVQTPYVSYKEELELVRDNDGEHLNFLTKYVPNEEKKERIENDMPKIEILNVTQEDFTDKLSNNVILYEFYDLLNGSGMIMLDYDFLFVVHDGHKHLKGESYEKLIDKATEKGMNICFIDINDKSADEIADICNEISSLLCEPGIINIEPEDIKGKDIIDVFIVKKREGVDFKKDYIETFENKVSKIKNLGQIVISITGGYDTGLEEIYEYVEAMEKVIPKDINLIFGTSMSKENNGICKIAIIFQSGDNNSLNMENIDGKLQLAHEKIAEENKKIKTIEDEVYSSEFYINQIDAFSELDEVSISTLQRFLRLGFSKAAKIIDDWTDKGYLEKNEHKWKVVNKQAIYDSLNEIFKEKL